ncbi:uncharacterized protein EDB91DRAFT_1338583 [Suillus paluster]|uniref:uncharacterized protein n=1 Tax=Suillus paluster TaxID=48578 RepID=UPI001B8823B2|nr:uncharacterized protein EDB91DRAFT_1338583 [Suillus paluster]KAG1731526.1 hypothetical protein EDB91DRAFT_1338583 [Suillus paluster]
MYHVTGILVLATRVAFYRPISPSTRSSSHHDISRRASNPCRAQSSRRRRWYFQVSRFLVRNAELVRLAAAAPPSAPNPATSTPALTLSTLQASNVPITFPTCSVCPNKTGNIISPAFRETKDSYEEWVRATIGYPLLIEVTSAEIPLLAALAHPKASSEELSGVLNYMSIQLMFERFTNQCSSEVAKATSKLWIDVLKDPQAGKSHHHLFIKLMAKLYLLEHVLQHPVVSEMENYAADTIYITNDIYSFKKEQCKDRALHNIITIIQNYSAS